MRKTFKIGKKVDDCVHEAIIKYQVNAICSDECMDEYKEAMQAIDSLTFFNTDNTDFKELAAWVIYTIFKIANSEKVCSAVFGDDEGDDLDRAIRTSYVGALGNAVNIYDYLVQLSDLIDKHDAKSEEK